MSTPERLEAADAFLDRSAAVLAEPEPLTACAWCSHPLDAGSPSGEFCGEQCAAYWRSGADWSPGERCVCQTCDPEAYAERDRIMSRWLGEIRQRSAASPARGLFQVMPSTYRERARTGATLHEVAEWFAGEQAARPYQWGGVPSVSVETFRVERALAEAERRLEEFRQRRFLGIDVTEHGSAVSVAHYDDAGNLVLESLTDLTGWTDMGWLQDRSADVPPAPHWEVASFQRHWLDRWVGGVETTEVPVTRWVGRKPNRRRRKRRG
jgi:hypothetical protein